MYTRRRNIVLTVLLILGAELLSAQTLPFRNYSVEHGLSESVANALLQDDRGFIWIGTGFGLNRFDGDRFDHFYEDDGLANNKTNALFQDSSRRIWVGTVTGVSVLEKDSLITPPHLALLNDFSITSIFQDRAGRFWYGTEANGIWTGEEREEPESVSREYRFGSIRAFSQTPDGSVWVASGEGLIRISSSGQTRYGAEEGLPSGDIRDVKTDPEGRLWIGTMAGLVVYKAGGFTVFDEDAGINDSRIQTITIESPEKIWVGTESGISVLEQDTFTNYTRSEGVSATFVYSSIMDREGNVWFGTLGGGVNLFTGDIFRNFSVDNGLTNHVVTGFDEDFGGNIWIATYGGGVLRYDGEHLRHFGEQDGLIDDMTYTVFTDSEGRVWIGTREGISIYENGEFSDFEAHDIDFRRVRKIYEDEEKGEFWIGTYNQGVYHLTAEGYEHYYTGNGLLNNTVMDIKKDSDGRFWMATYGGVAIYENGEFRHFTVASGLPSNGVIHVHIDHEGDKWFSTFNGPAVYRDGQEQVERLIRTEQIETIFYFTIQDEQNRYWFGTNRGLNLFRKNDFYASDTELERMLSYRKFTQNQGLVANELNAGASFLASDGSIWLGSIAGLSHFFPDRVMENKAPPGLEFREILISGRPVEPEDDLKFRSDRNFLQATLSALSYEAPEQMIFEYRLKGFETAWTVTKENVISYPALPPGKYGLEVRTYNPDGVGSADTASFAFQIMPPFYFQWWFILLLIMLLGGLAILFLRYFRVSKQVDIERMRVQIASDLHDDVGSSLTELALQTDFLQAGDLDNGVKETLQQLGDQSRKIVSSLDDIVWSIDSRNDTAGDLTDRMQDYVNHIFRHKEIDVRYHFDQLKMSEKLPVDVKENVYLIFKESVNNILKHSNGTRVDILFSIEGKKYELLVQDNGSLNGKSRKSGQGLRNIKMRAERIGSAVEIKPEDGYTIRATGSVI